MSLQKIAYQKVEKLFLFSKIWWDDVIKFDESLSSNLMKWRFHSLNLKFWYIDTRTIKLTSTSIRLTSSSITLTLVNQIRKKVAKSSAILHACCTRNALKVSKHESFVDLMSWSSAFEFYKNDSNRAIFDVDYQAWNKSFLKLFSKFQSFDVLRERTLKK
jgi:hypothetical protein